MEIGDSCMDCHLSYNYAAISLVWRSNQELAAAIPHTCNYCDRRSPNGPPAYAFATEIIQ
jgi:hypothetical protein